MTRVLSMIPVMRDYDHGTRIVAADADADDTMTVVYVITTVATVTFNRTHAISTTEGMDVNLGIMTAAMMTNGKSKTICPLLVTVDQVHILQML